VQNMTRIRNSFVKQVLDMLCNCEVVRQSDSKHIKLLASHNPWDGRWVVMLSSSFAISKDDLT